MERTDWAALLETVRLAVTEHTGPVLSARTATEGLNSAVAILLATAGGTAFVKGLPRDHPGVVTQQREAIINPYVLPVAPRLLWQIEISRWNLLGFQHVTGRHASYQPGSPDLPKLTTAMRRLARIRCPASLPVKQADQRWAAYVDSPSDLDWLRGDSLLHTDYNPFNILIDDRRAHIIDWAWPTKGAALIDPACLILRLMAAGHTPAQAEAVAMTIPAWNHAPVHAVNAFATANARLWQEIAADGQHPWKQHMAAVADHWAEHRLHGTGSDKVPAPQPARA